jgi:hypothetical protein
MSLVNFAWPVTICFPSMFGILQFTTFKVFIVSYSLKYFVVRLGSVPDNFIETQTFLVYPRKEDRYPGYCMARCNCYFPKGLLQCSVSCRVAGCLVFALADEE